MTSRMHLKSGRSAGNSAHAWSGTTSRVTVINNPKVSFWPDGNTRKILWLLVIIKDVNDGQQGWITNHFGLWTTKKSGIIILKCKFQPRNGLHIIHRNLVPRSS
jgi:hypothetical protein